MPLLVYRFSEYEHTAEREQFRSLCKQLHQFYRDKEEFCIFIGNYNIFDCELDAILIKADAIIGIEFKNYGGNITARENGQWTLDDGTIVKGGSRKSVYQQAKLNHVAIKRGFKEGGIFPSKMLKDVAGLVVFHQNVNVDNQLSPRVQSWLHICDERTFMEKVQDITSVNVCLSQEAILKLRTSLNLSEEYIVEDYSCSITCEHSSIITEAKEKSEASENNQSNRSKLLKTPDEYLSHKVYIEELVTTVCYNNENNLNVEVLGTDDFLAAYPMFSTLIEHDTIVLINGNIEDLLFQRLKRFIQKEILEISPTLCFWQTGEKIKTSHIQQTKIAKDSLNNIENNESSIDAGFKLLTQQNPDLLIV